MILAIDAGNTNVVFALFEEGKIRAQWRSAHEPHRTADEYAVWLTHLMALEGLAPSDVEAAVMANVVPASQHNLERLCRRYFDCAVLNVGRDGVGLGIKVLTDNPKEVGADRLVNAVAAHESYGGPVIIIDFGTATTFDIINGEGNYIGGIIAPGMDLSLEALYMAAAKLPLIAVEQPEKIIGTNTVSAMQSGIFWGYVSLVEGMVARIRAEFGEEMKVVATGGLSGLLARATDVIETSDKDMTLRGLYSIYKRNKKQ